MRIRIVRDKLRKYMRDRESYLRMRNNPERYAAYLAKKRIYERLHHDFLSWSTDKRNKHSGTNGRERLQLSRLRICKLLIEGKSTPEIAKKLQLKEGTVKQHLTNLYHEFKIPNSRHKRILLVCYLYYEYHQSDMPFIGGRSRVDELIALGWPAETFTSYPERYNSPLP